MPSEPSSVEKLLLIFVALICIAENPGLAMTTIAIAAAMADAITSVRNDSVFIVPPESRSDARFNTGYGKQNVHSVCIDRWRSDTGLCIRLAVTPPRPVSTATYCLPFTEYVIVLF